MTDITLADGDEVVFEGRRYVFRMGALNCESVRHYHAEPHADGSPGDVGHHHHEARCANIPRQATLYPAGEAVTRHAHEYIDGVCECGAERIPLRRVDSGGRREQDPRWWVQYRMPADASHPDGWSYEHREELVREPRSERPARLFRGAGAS